MQPPTTHTTAPHPEGRLNPPEGAAPTADTLNSPEGASTPTVPETNAMPTNLHWAPTAESLFLTRVPLLRHMPSRTRKQFADVWTKEWRAFNYAESETARTTALLRVFALPKCILLSPPKQRHRDSDPALQSTRLLVRDRLRRWEDGETRQMWHTATQRARRAAERQTTGVPTRAQRLERAKQLAQEGAFAKAMRALDARGVHAPTARVQQILEEKHPQTPPPPDAAHAISTNDGTLPPLPRFTKFTTAEILKAAKRFPRGSAGGGPGMTPTHLLELLQSPEADRTGGLLEALATGLSELATGKGPEQLAPWIAGAPLTALRKDDNGVRPIAVGETIRRLISSTLLARSTTLVRELLCPLQVGVATSGGCEAVVHAVREIAHRHGSDSRLGLLQLDLRNAFNCVSRAAFRNQVCRYMPELHGWTEYCYGTDTTPELWIHNGGQQSDHYRLKSVCGVQQGDPLGPLLFTLALRPVLHCLDAKMQEWRESTRMNDPTLPNLPSFLSFYLDDGVIVDRHEVLKRAIDFMNSDEARVYGLHLCVRKCNLWWPTPPSQETDDSYPVSLARIRQPGHNVLKSPVGEHRRLVEEIDARIARLEPTFNDVADLNDAQTTLALLRVTMGVCQVNYLLRTVPASATKRGTLRFDGYMYEAVNKLVGGTMDTDVFRELQLPLRPLEDGTHTMGIGLQSAVSPAAYLASVTQHIISSERWCLRNKIWIYPSFGSPFKPTECYRCTAAPETCALWRIWEAQHRMPYLHNAS